MQRRRLKSKLPLPPQPWRRLLLRQLRPRAPANFYKDNRMSAYQLYLDSVLEEAVLQQALSLREAWLVQDQMLLQQSERLILPAEWAPMLDRLHLSQLDKPESLPLQ
jgi:hypothetical protein